MSALNIARYDNGGGDLDLGIVAQILWNTKHGNFLHTSIYTTRGSILKEHFNPLYVPMAAMYYWREDPRLILVLQAIVLGSAIVPLGLFAGRYLGGTAGLLVALAYALNPIVHYINYFDFHPVTVALPFIFTAFALRAHGRRRAGDLVLAAALFLDEAVTVTVTVYAFILWLRDRRSRGLTLFLAGLAVLALYYAVIIPAVSGDHAYASVAADYFRYLPAADGDSRLVSALTHPRLLAAQLLTARHANYLATLLFAFGALPLFTPWLLLPALPQLLFNLLSGFPDTATIHLHYNTLIVAFAYPAAVCSIRAWQRRLAAPRSVGLILSALLCGCSLFLHGSDSPLPCCTTRQFHPEGIAAPERFIPARPLLAAIQPQASVLTTFKYWSYLAHRPGLYLLEREWRAADYILWDGQQTSFSPERRAAFLRGMAARTGTGEYRLLRANEGIYLWQRQNGSTLP